MNTPQNIPPLASYDIDHLGIVAGIIDEIGIVEEIDALLGNHKQEVLSSGLSVKAMILNALGFVSAPLYLFQEFFVGKATELLLGEGIRPEHLNDDKLGKVLDKLYEADLSQVFVRIALKAARHVGVDRRVVHLDATSFHVHGNYASLPAPPVTEPAAESMPGINITYGYSREQRPDLKQFMVDMISSSDADVPLYFRAADGNEADRAVFAKLIKEYQQQLDVEALFVADSALYSAENLQSLSGLAWLSRVPQSIREAKLLLQTLDEDAFVASSLPGYRIAEQQVTYGDVPQRWLIIASSPAQARTDKQQGKRLAKQEQAQAKALRALMQRPFHCRQDAEQALADFQKTLRVHQLANVAIVPKKKYAQRGRPTPDTPYTLLHYIQAELVVNDAAVADQRKRSSRFILASNILDPARYSNDDLLSEYKAQQSVERGFRFLRDPLFFTSSVFLKTPARVAALALIMALSLLVYTLGQRCLRHNLANQQATIRHQTGKPTSKPTLRWVFQMFQAVHLILLADQQHISNLSLERQNILGFLYPACRKYYLLI